MLRQSLILLPLCAFPPLAAQSPVYQYQGSSTDAWLGHSVANAGDVNLDGTEDFLIGMPRGRVNGEERGIVFVYSGATGVELYQLQGDGYRDAFGDAVCGAGDVNLDGYADFLVGATENVYHDYTGPGYVRMFSGQDGSVLFTVTGTGSFDRLGTSVARLGDLNNDSVPDFVAAADQAGAHGKAFVYSGVDGSLLFEVQHPGNGYLFGFGFSVAAAGDVNLDSYPDIFVGDPFHKEGRVLLYSGLDGSLLETWWGDNMNDNFGWDVASGFDLNQDGYPDLVAGAPQENLGNFDFGYIRARSGMDGSILWTLQGYLDDSAIGQSVSRGGDFDGDGTIDFLVGSPSDDLYGNNRGSARIVSGQDGHVLMTFRPVSSPGSFGYDVAADGDFNNDGKADFIIGAIFDSQGAPQSGAAYVYLSSDFLFLTEPNPGIAGAANTVQVSQATPGASVWLTYSFQVGPSVTASCQWVDSDLIAPRFVGSMLANGSGVANFVGQVPPSMSGRTLYMQAFEPSNCKLSNLVAYTFP